GVVDEQPPPRTTWKTTIPAITTTTAIAASAPNRSAPFPFVAAWWRPPAIDRPSACGTGPDPTGPPMHSPHPVPATDDRGPRRQPPPAAVGSGRDRPVPASSSVVSRGLPPRPGNIVAACVRGAVTSVTSAADRTPLTRRRADGTAAAGPPPRPRAPQGRSAAPTRA